MTGPQEDQDIRAYVRALEERVMLLEAKLSWSSPMQEGYMRGAPEGAAEIGRQTCAESACEQCGHLGLVYDPHIRLNPKSYLAYAWCPACSYRRELVR